MNKRLVRCALAGLLAAAAMGAQAFGCDDLWGFIGRPCSKGAAAWDHGDNELILTGYAYHLRSTYTEEKLRELNERDWGAGWARSVTDADGDEHMLFLFAFHESHRKVEWNAGYAYTAFWGSRDGLRAGLGYAAFIVQRPDIANGVPIPALLPLAAVAYGKATLIATFIPTVNNGVNNGSVLFVFGKYKF
jgi:lipid IVA palmitoyltransferase